MPDTRGTVGFGGGFAQTSGAMTDRFNAELAAKQQQQDQINLLREQAITGVGTTLEEIAKAQKQFSTAFYTSKGINDQKGMAAATAGQEEFVKTLWDSTEQTLRAVNLPEAQISIAREKFRMGAALNNPAAEQRLEETEKTRGAVNTEAGKGRVEQQQVQTSDITGYLNTKNNDVVRGYVKNGRAFNAVTNEELSADYIPTKSLSGVEGGAGVGNSTKDKTLAAAAELRAVQENTDNAIGELQSFVRSEDYVGGFSEDAIQLLNSGIQQIYQITGTSNVISESILDQSALDLDNLSDANIGFLRRAAIGGDVRDSAKSRLAYVIAKQLDPGGKISNADVDNAERILSGSADQSSTLLMLGQLRARAARETNVRLKTMEQLLKSPETLFEKMDVTTGLKTNQNLDDMSDADFIQLLNQGGQ